MRSQKSIYVYAFESESFFIKIYPSEHISFNKWHHSIASVTFLKFTAQNWRQNHDMKSRKNVASNHAIYYLKSW